MRMKGDFKNVENEFFKMSKAVQAKQNPSADDTWPTDSILGLWIVKLSLYADVLLTDWQIWPLEVHY